MPKNLTQNEFIEKSKNLFNNITYDKTIYVNGRTNVILTCKFHGDWSMPAKDHISYKRGCPYCSGVKYNTQTFIERAKKVHGNKFNYDKSIFINVKKPVSICCKIHGDFTQMPDKHINAKHGCPKCDKSHKKDLEYFLRKANEIHNNYYSYDNVDLLTMSSLVLIECPKHGLFNKRPTEHINKKSGCPRCSVAKSRKEKEWLDSLQIPNDREHRSVILWAGTTRYIVDGYDPSTNTIYEFYGDYWHGNPKRFDGKDMNKHIKITFGELYEKTMKKEKLLMEAGYKLVTQWENSIPRKKRKS